LGGDAAVLAKLGVYNVTTGERLALVDIGAVFGSPSPKFFAKDVTVDGAGNAYVTDTMNNVVYRVTPDYQASVLHRFTGLPEGSQVNGIVYHDGGYLLVVAGENIYKVPVANPAGTTQVNVAQPVAGQDGIVWAADGRLVATSNSETAPALVAFRSNDNWASAQTVGFAPLTGQATTAAAVGDDIYVVHPHFADADAPSIELAEFK
jgi:hypothetical protein